MRPSNKRSRSKQNRPRTLGNIVNRVFDSSGPEGKVRGTPQQIIDKYLLLSRDAQLSGDRVAAENFAQHAEHYTRMLNEAQAELAREAAERQQQQAQQGGGQSGGNPSQQRRTDPRDGDEGEAQAEGRQDQGRAGEQRSGDQRNGDQRNGDQRNGEQKTDWKDRRNRRFEDRRNRRDGGDPRDDATREGGSRGDTAEGESTLVETPESRNVTAPSTAPEPAAAEARSVEPHAGDAAPVAEKPAVPAEPQSSGGAAADEAPRPRRRAPRKPRADSATTPDAAPDAAE